MTLTNWADATAAIQHWCVNDDGGYAIDSADRLVHRLAVEYCTSSKQWRHQHEHLEELEQLHEIMIEKWLALAMASSTQHQGCEKVALARAETLILRMLDWTTMTTSDDVPIVNDAALQVLGRHMTRQHYVQAAQFLLQWTSVLCDSTASDQQQQQELMAPYFYEILTKCIDNNKDVSLALLEQMDYLRQECGWTNLEEPSADVINAVLQSSEQDTGRKVSAQSEDDTSITPDQELSSFEARAIQTRALEFIQTADKDNVEKVAELRKTLDDESPELAAALLEFYIRIQDVQEALNMLQQCMNMENVTQEQLEAVLELLAASSNVKEAPWRAQELVQRMQHLEESKGQISVTTTSYNALLKCWIKSGEQVAPTRVLEIFQTMANSTESSKTPDGTSYQLLLEAIPKQDIKSIEVVMAVLAKQWANVDAAVLQQLVESIMTALANNKMGRQAHALLKMVMEKNMTPSPVALKAAFRALAHSKEPQLVLNLLQDAELKGMQLSFEAYETAIFALLNGGQKGYFEKEKALILHVLDKVASGELSAPCQDAVTAALLEKTLSKMKLQKRAIQADQLLKCLLESNHATLLSTTCYNHVLKAWSDAGRADKVDQVYELLLQRTDLVPDKVTFGIYLSVLANNNKRTKGHQGEKAEAALDVMLDLVNRHEHPFRDNLMPDDGHFNSVLLAIQKQGSSDDAVERSMLRLNQMLDLGIQPETFTFNVVMNTVLRFARDESYSRIVALQDQMMDCGLEPNRHSHRAILNACVHARPSEASAALDVATRSMGQLRQLGAANAACYSTFVKAILHLLPAARGDERRQQLLESTYSLAHADLQQKALDPVLERQFQSAMTQQDWSRLSTRVHTNNGTQEQTSIAS